jgi:hypothetical protein
MYVPNHLIARLIGKQGKCVSELQSQSVRSLLCAPPPPFSLSSSLPLCITSLPLCLGADVWAAGLECAAPLWHFWVSSASLPTHRPVVSSSVSAQGARIQIQRENEMKPGQKERLVTLGGSQDSIKACQSLITRMVAEWERADATGEMPSRGHHGCVCYPTPTPDRMAADEILLSCLSHIRCLGSSPSPST